MKYGLLKQTNPAYRAKLWQTLDDLYVGGFQLLDRADQYIPRQVGEPPERYKERIEQASYVPYLGMIVDSYAANLFAAEPIVVPADDDATKLEPFWAEFAKDANLQGDDFSRILRGVFTEALLKQRALIACDFPATSVAPASRAQEDALGAARAYAFDLPIEDLRDWEYSDIVTRRVPLKSGGEVTYSFGLMAWAILRRVICARKTPSDSRGTLVEEFRLWTLGDDGRARWELYRTAPRATDAQPPPDDDDLPIVDEGTTSFRQIPIVEMCLPPGLWLGNKLGPIALDLFRRRSALNASQNRSLFPIPVAYLGSEIGGVGEAMPSEAQQNPSRGNDPVGEYRRRGFLVFGKDDKLEYLEPEGVAFEQVDKQITDTVDEFFRVAHMMASSVSSTSKALGRSGESKAQDWRSMAVVLEAYGAIVRDTAQRVYTLIAEARGEQYDWRVHGLDKFDVVDRQIVLEEAKTLSLVSIPSNTFRAHWQTKVALALLGNVTPDMQEQIEEEIEAGIAAEEQIRQVMLEEPEDVRDQEDDAGAADGRNGDGGAGEAGATDGEGAAPRRAPKRQQPPRIGR